MDDSLTEILKPLSSVDAVNEVMINCFRCPRLVVWREEVARTKRRAFRDWTYWGRPVPGFGDPQARLYILGLAPAAHGGNRTGRVFTGDSSGDFLFRALFHAGFASQPTAVDRDDGLTLRDVYIGASARCAPPDNKPTPVELTTCRPYVMAELRLLKNLQGIVALGAIAFESALTTYRQLGFAIPRLKFGHGVQYALGPGLPWLMGSYHPSQQNTQTGRLTPAMFADIWSKTRETLK